MREQEYIHLPIPSRKLLPVIHRNGRVYFYRLQHNYEWHAPFQSEIFWSVLTPFKLWFRRAYFSNEIAEQPLLRDQLPQ